MAGSVLAQGGKKDPVFDVPEQRPPPAVDRADPRAEIWRTVQRLAGWPHERARQAAERLVVQKENSRELILDVLISARPEHSKLKPGAAYVLGRIGEPEHFLTLLHVVIDKDQHRHASVFFDAAYRLDPKQTVAETFRFFHLSETTLRREAVKFVLARIAPENLPAVRKLLDRRHAERPFTREIGLRLLDRLVQTRQVEWDEVTDRFYRALGDESPQVSSRAMRLLASRNDASNIEALNNLITKEMSYWRQRSYAAMSLGLLASAYKEQPFSPEAIAVLRGELGLGHPKETLARAGAALALAQVALRTNDKRLVRLLDREVPIVLIDAVGASRHHYRDFGSVAPYAFTMLRRITGENFPDHAPAWAKWWRDNGERFRAKRELNGVQPEDLKDVMVEVTPPAAQDGGRVRLTVLGKQRPTFLHGRAYAVPARDMEAIVDLLKGHAFFDRPEADAANQPRDAALVVMRVGDLTRSVAYGVGERETKVRDEILAQVAWLENEYSWELWWDIDAQPAWELFVLENRRWFERNKDEAARADRLRTLITGAINDVIAPETRLHAARTLARLQGGAAALTPAQVEKLVAAVGQEREANAFVAEVVDLLVPEAGPQAATALVGALADKVDPRAQDLLTHLCAQLEPAQTAALAADTRWQVRRAAVAALADAPEKVAVPVLTARLVDDEPMVRAAAALALARRRDPAVMAALPDLAESRSPNVRATAAYAYGLIGGRAGRAGIRPLLYGDRSAAVRVRAIQGLVDGGDPGAANMLLDVFKNENDIRVRARAASAIVQVESPELVDKLITRLQYVRAADPERVALVNILARFKSDRPVEILQAVLQGDDQASADAAALGLARRWDDTSLIQLIRMVKRANSRSRTAARHLQILTSRAFEAEDWVRQADNYAGWATTHADGNPRSWFVDALNDRGYETEALAEFAAARGASLPPIADAAVPVLLAALRDEDWFIVRNASFLLNHRIGSGAPDVITFSTPSEEAEAAIRAYNAWWAKTEAEKRAREQG